MSKKLLESIPQFRQGFCGLCQTQVTSQTDIGSLAKPQCRWAALHNPANFRDPNEFIPERWVDDAYASDSKIAMQPFSLGLGVISARGKTLQAPQMKI